jgi:hypothetical protein
MKCRKRIGDVETGGMWLTRDKSGGSPDCRPDGIRHEGGVTLHLALARNVGTCRLDAKGKVQAGGPARAKVPTRGTGAGQPIVGTKVR